MTVGMISAKGGNGAGMGANGRVRVDTPSRANIASMPGVGHRGPMFAITAPMVVREQKPQLPIVGEPDALIKYVIDDGEGTTRGPDEFTMSPTGEMNIPFGVSLFRGYNKLCLLVSGVETRRPEAENCITIAYLY
jgi:hypothetical protein